MTYMDNHTQHNNRISRYKPVDYKDAINIIYNLRKSDFNSYSQMLKDIKIICEVVNEQEREREEAITVLYGDTRLF